MENMDIAEIKKVLVRVMIDYRIQANEMKKERENIKKTGERKGLHRN